VFQCLLIWMSFIITNQEVFEMNLSLHNLNTRNEHHLHRPDGNLSCFQKSTFFAGITNFQILSPIMTSLKNDKAKFKAALRKYLHTHSLYFVDDLSLVKMICNFLWCVCILHCKFVYLCVYDLFHILLSLWHTCGSMECVCVYACMYDLKFILDSFRVFLPSSKKDFFL